jgi:hypothetical protein
MGKGFAMRTGSWWALAALLAAGVGLLSAQREGPLEVKGPRKRPAAPASKQRPAEPLPPCRSEAEAAGRECVWSEVEVSAEGRVLAQRVHPPGYDPVLARAFEQVQRFAELLPDFLCEQVVYRFDSDSRPPRWRLRDRVSAEVLYAGGRETYQNIRRNGKPVDYARVESTGTWSTGEFGTLLQGLFFPSTAARFSFVREAAAGAGRARLYDFSVPQQSSHWRVEFEGRILYPAYQGSLWIHPDRAGVLRIEMQARDVPASYPMDVIEMTVDYAAVPIAGQHHWLPVRAENLACKRYSTYCTRNEIVFTNFRKFTTESVITTTDSTIRYEEAAPRR